MIVGIKVTVTRNLMGTEQRVCQIFIIMMRLRVLPPYRASESSG